MHKNWKPQNLLNVQKNLTIPAIIEKNYMPLNLKKLEYPIIVFGILTLS